MLHQIELISNLITNQSIYNLSIINKLIYCNSCTRLIINRIDDYTLEWFSIVDQPHDQSEIFFEYDPIDSNLSQ